MVRRGAFHFQGKNPFVFKKNPSKIRVNPFVLIKSRTLFPMREVPLVVRSNLSCKFLLEYKRALDGKKQCSIAS